MNKEDFLKLKLAVVSYTAKEVAQVYDIYRLADSRLRPNNAYPNFAYMKDQFHPDRGVQTAYRYHNIEWNYNDDYYKTTWGAKVISLKEFLQLARRYNIGKTPSKNVRRVNWGKMNEASDKGSFKLPEATVVCFENLREAFEASEIMQKANYSVFSPENIKRYYHAVQRAGEGKFCINFIKRQYSGDSFYKEYNYNIISLKQLKKLAAPYGLVPVESRNIRRVNWGKLKESKFLNKIDVYLNEQLMNEKYDMETLKEKLPRVRVNFDGEEHTGYMKVGDTDFAYVHLDDLPGTKFKYDWETILDAVNNGTVLET